MNHADLSGLLIETAAAVTAAVVLVMSVRRPLRSAFGASVAYAAWSLVPVALIAVLLPAATVPMVLIPIAAADIPMTVTAVTERTDMIDVRLWACVIWALGVAGMALHFNGQQRRFLRGLGRTVRREDGLVEAEAMAGLPAAIGLLRPRIVLPADYRTRYSIEQQTLMQLHERTHVARGDLQVNAFVALLRCLFWFNPLLHYAARHFRHDQELSCDQRVIARHPHARRAYGEAMFKTQLAAQPLPLGCHWGNIHPLKERIEMLKQPIPTLSRWLGGVALVIALTAMTGFAAWASQQAQTALTVEQGQKIDVRLRLTLNGQTLTFPRIITRSGQPFSIRQQGDQDVYAELIATSRDVGKIDLAGKIYWGDKLISEPNLQLVDASPVTIPIDVPTADVWTLVLDASIAPERLVLPKYVRDQLSSQSTRTAPAAGGSALENVILHAASTLDVPEGVEVTSLKEDGGTLLVAGRTQSQIRMAGFLSSLEKSGWAADLTSMAEAKDPGVPAGVADSDKAMPYAFMLRAKPPKD